DAVDEVLGAAVTQVIAVHAGDHHVLQAHVCNRLGEPARLVGIRGLGPAVGHVAEAAAPRAYVAQDHEGRRAVAEALVDVGAAGVLAHGHQPVFAQLGLERGHRAVGGDPHPDPRRLAQHRRVHELHRRAGDLVRRHLALTRPQRPRRRAGRHHLQRNGLVSGGTHGLAPYVMQGAIVDHGRSAARPASERPGPWNATPDQAASASSSGLEAGSTARPSWRAIWPTSTGATSSRPDGPPKSATDATCMPAYPHGLMRENGSRSMAMLKASPWKVQPRRTRMPSAATLAPAT